MNNPVTISLYDCSVYDLHENSAPPLTEFTKLLHNIVGSRELSVCNSLACYNSPLRGRYDALAMYATNPQNFADMCMHVPPNRLSKVVVTAAHLSDFYLELIKVH